MPDYCTQFLPVLYHIKCHYPLEGPSCPRLSYFILADVKGSRKICNFVFLQITMPRSSDLDTHKCSQCHRTYSSLYNLRAHEATHRGRYPYWCKVCGKGFQYTTHLRGHMAQHRGLPESLSSNVTFAAASFVIHTITLFILHYL